MDRFSDFCLALLALSGSICLILLGIMMLKFIIWGEENENRQGLGVLRDFCVRASCC